MTDGQLRRDRKDVYHNTVCRSIFDVSPQWAQSSKIDDKFLLFVNVKDLKCVGIVFLCVLVYWEINSSPQDVISFPVQRGGYSVEEVLQYQPNDMSSCLTACHLCCWSFCKCGSFIWLIIYWQIMWMNFIQVLVAIKGIILTVVDISKDIYEFYSVSFYG